MTLSELNDFAKLFHDYSKIPTYVYQGQEISAAFPKPAPCCYPPALYFDRLLEGEASIRYCVTVSASLYGSIRVKNTDLCLLVGPVSPHGFHRDNMPPAFLDYPVSDSEKQAIQSFLAAIPPMGQSHFIRMMHFLNYSINREAAASDCFDSLLTGGVHLAHSSFRDLAIGIQDIKEAETTYNNYSIEQELLQIIRDGDLDRLEEYSRKAQQESRFGDLSSSHLRREKTVFIIADTLISRAAIEGGLSGDIAYSMSDLYIRQAEQLTDPREVITLTQIMMRDFCRKVHDNKTLYSNDDQLMRVINYIHSHTNVNLDTETVAEAMGMSRSHLSRKFKQQLGFNISDFIRRCKLEESKQLLKYTDKSISEISSYLCFSSQAHFQTLFKKQFGMTPMEYRKL